jgi:hypothetical protein
MGGIGGSFGQSKPTKFTVDKDALKHMMKPKASDLESY